MDNENVEYIDAEGNLLFKEVIPYGNIPPVGRHVKWHTFKWVVSHILENWDSKKTIVTLQLLTEIN
ncbi:hypothetical protein GCM10007424_23600 [Flavobacterium suaedae]|uniref:Uncharacterized protein n=1 Tax=Flavobacterium suaedae TaxID=1767027 RepID=A0ABQ1K2D5_9FLAO|nr:hypothetical protein [Flavobacterium suaedae]GGB82852.1 hypothetical protein GCM10007424_23600 [Flavobacterium suaedae]